MIKKILKFILNFVLSVLILVLISSNIFSITIFDREYIKQKLKSNDFYIRSYSDIVESFENYTMQSGLDLEILDGLIAEGQVADDINRKMDSLFTKINGDIDTSSIRTELDNRINNVLAENGRVPSDKEKESIKKYEDAIEKAYKDGILYGANFSVSLNVKYINRCNAICIVGIIIISIALIIVCTKPLRYLACLGIGLLFSGIFSISAKLLIENRIKNIIILDSKFSALIVNILNDILSKFFVAGIVLTVIGILLIFIGNIRHKKSNNS